MTAIPLAPVASRPEESRFLVLRVPAGVRRPNSPHFAIESIGVGGVPDLAPITSHRWPSFEGLALLERRLGALTSLFVNNLTTPAAMKCRLPPRVVAAALPTPSERSHA
jgi:hypothetical protein